MAWPEAVVKIVEIISVVAMVLGGLYIIFK